MADWYSATDTAATEALFARIRRWGEARGDITTIGGAAVRELVKPPLAAPTRDLDFVLHTESAFRDFDAQLAGWSLRWRRRGRTVYKECHVIGKPPVPPVIDVFTVDASIGAALFTMEAGRNVEAHAKGQAFLPTLPYLIDNKLRTVPLRSGDTASDKRAKDLWDLHQLIFHNREDAAADELARGADPRRRGDAARFLAEAIAERPNLRTDFERLRRWLKT